MSRGMDSFEFPGGACRGGQLEFDKDAGVDGDRHKVRGSALISDDDLAELLRKGSDQKRVAEFRATPVEVGGLILGTMGEWVDAFSGPTMACVGNGAVECNPAGPAKPYGRLLDERAAQAAAEMQEGFVGPVVSIGRGAVSTEFRVAA